MSLEAKWLEFVRRGAAGPLEWPARAGLQCLSLGYRAASAVHRSTYHLGLRRARTAPMPVISVGNLTLGGTGKTEFSILLARRLLDIGATPGILLRGYRRPGEGHGDEFTLMRERLPEHVPVIEGPDRSLSATLAHEAGARVAILDDGHQHQRLQKDLRILLFDASRPEDLARVFPAGLLREPLGAVATADLVCLTRVDQAPTGAVDDIGQLVARHGYSGPILEAEHRPLSLRDPATDQVRPLTVLANRSCIAISGIGNNTAFARSLTALGADVVAHWRLDDHHRYTSADGVRLTQLQEEHPESLVVTTAKDAPRLLPVTKAVSVCVLDVDLQVCAGEDELMARLRRLVARGADACAQ